MKKRMKIMLIALAIVFGGIILFNFIKSMLVKHFFANYTPPAVSVSSVKAVQKNWKPYLSAVGNFVAINGVDVNSQSLGKVTAIHFESGQYVEQGSLLLDIDDTVDQANLKYNQANLALQKTNYQRQLDLIKRNATATSSVDEAKARLLEAEADLEKTQATIDQKHIRAPFSGMLGIRQVDLGQYIQPGQTAIVTLQSMDPIFLKFYLPEQNIKRLSINQGIIFTVEQNPNMAFEGKITAINSKVDPNTHMIEVQATLANCPAHFSENTQLVKTQPYADKTLVSCATATNAANKITQFNFIPGMFASIEVDQPDIPNVVVLPTTAISYTMYGDSVFIIQQSKERDDHDQPILTVKRVFVTTSEQQGNYTVIKKGIKAGQLVVAAGELKLQDGTRVTINNDIKLPDNDNIEQLGQ